MIYIAATALTSLAAFAFERRRRWLWLAVLAAVPLCVVAAARWNVGTDFRRTYLPMYRALERLRGSPVHPNDEKAFIRLARKDMYGGTPVTVYRHFKSVLGRTEPGYRLLMEGALRSGLGFRAVLAVCAALTALFVFFAIFRFSRWPSLAAFLYVATGNYFLSLNIMRQYVAVALGLVAVAYILNRRPWMFLACVAAAASFHVTALALLPLYALSRWELTPVRGVALIIAALLFSLAAAPLLHWTLDAIGAEHYLRYFTGGLADDGFEWAFFAINCCFLLMGAWYWRGATAGNRYFAIWYGMTVVGTAVLAFSHTVPVMKRINFYYAAPQFLMLPEMLLAETNPRRRKILVAFAVAAFAAETAVAVYWLNKNGVLPYSVGRLFG